MTRIRNSIGMDLTPIPPGRFVMGSSSEEHWAARGRVEPFVLQMMPEIYLNEWPQHAVHITKSFYCGVVPVTQAQYTAVMGVNPSVWQSGHSHWPAEERVDTGTFPVENVSHADAEVFCARLSGLAPEADEGRTYRLPTEAEWEYCCRAGDASSPPFHVGVEVTEADAHIGPACYRSDPPGGWRLGTCSVGSYPPNAFGLYDMHGNVAEWCSDWYSVDYYAVSPEADPTGPCGGHLKVVRGGSHGGPVDWCRSACRDHLGPRNGAHCVGFRVVMEVSP